MSRFQNNLSEGSSEKDSCKSFVYSSNYFVTKFGPGPWAIMAVALPHWEARPGSRATTQQCVIDTAWADTGTWGRHRAVLTQVLANNGGHFDKLTEHSPVNSGRYPTVLPVLEKEFENRFQECWKKNHFFFLIRVVTPCPVNINTLLTNFQMECVKLQSDIRLNNLIVSLYQTFISPILPETPPRFTIMPYPWHCCLTLYGYVLSCFWGWSTGGVKLDQKSLMST